MRGVPFMNEDDVPADKVIDFAGQVVRPGQPDYLYWRALAAAQIEWAQHWVLPEGNSHREEQLQNIEVVENHLLRAAQAIEMGMASPYAMERLRTALKLTVSMNARQHLEMEAAYEGPMRRRAAASHGYDYDVLLREDRAAATRDPYIGDQTLVGRVRWDRSDANREADTQP